MRGEKLVREATILPQTRLCLLHWPMALDPKKYPNDSPNVRIGILFLLGTD